MRKPIELNHQEVDVLIETLTRALREYVDQPLAYRATLSDHKWLYLALLEKLEPEDYQAIRLRTLLSCWTLPD